MRSISVQGLELERPSPYKSEGFQVLTSIRPTFLLHFLEAGYSVFYNDADMVWKRDALRILNGLDQGQTFLVPGVGGACTSTIYMSPTSANIRFCKAWQREMATGKHGNDQFGFNAVLKTQPEGKNLRVVWGDGRQFPTADTYFKSSWNKERAYDVHNNKLQFKFEKASRFRRVRLWGRSGRLGEYQCANPKETS